MVAAGVGEARARRRAACRSRRRARGRRRPRRRRRRRRSRRASSSATSAARPACSTLAEPRSPSSALPHRADARAAAAHGWRAEGADSGPAVSPVLLTWGRWRAPFNLFGDPEEFRARMEELSEQMQSSQRVAWADNAIKLAVEMTVASIGRLDLDRQRRRAGDAGPRRDPRPLPRGRHPGARGPRRPQLARLRTARSAARSRRRGGEAAGQLDRDRDQQRRDREDDAGEGVDPPLPGLRRRHRRRAAQGAEGDVVAEGDAVEQRLPGRGEARPAAPSGATSRPGRGGRRAAAPPRP